MKKTKSTLKSLLLAGFFSSTSLLAQTNIAIINKDIKDHELIINSLTNTKIYFADVTKTSGQILNEIISQNTSTEIKNLMIFGHGEQGQFELGSTKVTSQNFSASLYELSVLKNANKLENIYLYGCNVAKGTVGIAFVNAMADNLKINIKASNNITGKGGDWELEIGNAPDNSALSKSKLSVFKSTLQVAIAGYTINTIPQGQFVTQIAVDNAGKNLYYANNTTTTGLYKVSLPGIVSSTVNSNWATGINAFLPYIGADLEYYNGYAYCFAYHNAAMRDSLAKISVSTTTASIVSFPVNPQTTGSYEAGAAIIGDNIYLTDGNLGSPNLFVYNFTSKTTTTLNVGLPTGAYETLEYNNTTNELYFSNVNTLYRVNLLSLTTTSIAALPSSSGAFAIDPTGQYVATQDGANVYLISLATGVSTVIVSSLGATPTQDLEFGPSTGISTCTSNNDVSLYVGKGNSLIEVKGFSKSINTLNINPLKYCVGQSQTFKLPYVASGNYCLSNIFTAELSNNVGSFAAPLTVGTKTTFIGSDTILCTIPSTLTVGAGYKLRVTSSSPTITGTSSAVTLTINALPTLSTTSTSSLLCIGQTASITANGASTYTWNTAATTSVIVVTPTITTNYTVTGSDANGCVNTSTITQAVSGCVSINQYLIDNRINLFPNPNNGAFNISVNSNMQNAELIIMNSIGQIVKVQSIISGNNAVNSKELAKGLYHYTVLENKVIISQGKLIIE